MTMRVSPGITFIFVFALMTVCACILDFLAGMGPAVYLSGAGIVSMIAFVDIALSKKDPAQITYQFPEVIRMSKNRTGKFSFTIQNTVPAIKRILLAMDFNEAMVAAETEKEIRLKNETTIANWPLTGLKQGRHHIDTCWMQIRSRLGFWELKRPVPIGLDLHIYPDITGQQKNLAAFFTRTAAGIHSRKHIGKGREFERLREYLPGDSYEDIHWKATARQGHPVTKIFQIEKTQDLYVMLDASRLSARHADISSGSSLSNGSRTTGSAAAKETILEKFITASLMLGLTARHQGDKFGVGIFSDRMEHFLKADVRKTHYNRCRDLLFDLTPRRVTPDFTEWITFIGNRIRKRSLIILLTSLDDAAIADSLLEQIHILSRRHLVLVNVLKPPHTAPLFYSGQADTTDDIYRHLAGHLQWDALRRMEKSLRKKGIGFQQHDPGKLVLQLISQYLNIKQRQAL